MIPIDYRMFQFNRGYTGFEDPHFITFGRLSDFVSFTSAFTYSAWCSSAEVAHCAYSWIGAERPGGCWWRLRDLSWLCLGDCSLLLIWNAKQPWNSSAFYLFWLQALSLSFFFLIPLALFVLLKVPVPNDILARVWNLQRMNQRWIRPSE